MDHMIRVTAEVTLENEEEVRVLITRCAQQALAHERVDFDAFIDVTIVDDENIRALNAEYREKDAVTDVLSFPMYEFVNGEAQEELEEDPESGKVMLGDMILNYQRATEQAAEFGHSAARECGFLTVLTGFLICSASITSGRKQTACSCAGMKRKFSRKWG